MTASLEFYLRAFCLLQNRDKTGDYEGLSLDGAPHQPVILLAVLDLYARDPSRGNFIELDDVLLELWTMYKDLLGISPNSSAGMPVFALRKTSFWHLVHKPGAPKPTARVRNRKGFHAHFVGVTLDDDLHMHLGHCETRKLLREALIRTYFPSERWLTLTGAPRKIADKELAISAYTHRLLDDPAFGGSNRAAEESSPYRTLRDSSFRKAVTFAYDYRCAFCGVRLRNPKNHVLVVAAHIVPWHKTHDDRPVNGLCLCPLCHWAFDARMLGLGLSMEILTHERIQSEDNLPGHLSTFKGRTIYMPKESRFKPDDACVKEQLRLFEAGAAQDQLSRA